MKNKYTTGMLYALGTAVLWGCMSPLSKYIGGSGVSMITVMTYRTVLVSLLLGAGLFLYIGPDWWRIGGKLARVYLVLSFLTVFMNACGFMMSCVFLSVPQALMIHYTFPLTTMAGAWAITRERPTVRQVFSGFMILAGLFIGFGGGGEGAVSLTGVAWGVCSLIGLSGQTLISRRILKGGATNPLVQLFYIHLFGFFMLFIGKSVISGWSDLAKITWPVFGLMQYAALGAGLLGFGFMFTALKYIPASLVSLICTLELVFALIITPLSLGLYPTGNELAGCAVIVAAVACAAWQKSPA